MTSHVDVHHEHHPHHDESEKRPMAEATASTAFLVPLGRVLFVVIFLLSATTHFSSGVIAYAGSQGVPAPSLLVPLSGLLALVGGLSIALGFYTRLGAWMLVGFLVPVTLMMHKFWAAPDAMTARMQQAMFLKNVSMLGGALLLTYFGGGPYSVDARRRH